MTAASARRRARLITGFAIVSIALHLVLLRALPRSPQSRAAATAATITLVIESHPEPAARPRAAPEAEASSSPSTPRGARAWTPTPAPAREAARAHELGPAPTPTIDRESLSGEAPAAVAAPVEMRSEIAAETTPESAGARAPDLAPRSAALSTLPAPATASPEAESDVARGARRSAELSAELRAVANAAPYREHRAPQLTRDADGTCHYAGSAIDATIAPDGGVRFDDRPPELSYSSLQPLARGAIMQRGGVPMPPDRPVTPDEQVSARQAELRVRITPRASQAERDWFLRETSGLRQELADAAHARELGRDEHDLRKQLDRIWCDAAQSPAQRRRAIFELWDDTSADEIGRRGRRIVLDYIRANLPRESPYAFPAAQLAALNAKRQQRGRFDPYAYPSSGM